MNISINPACVCVGVCVWEPGQEACNRCTGRWDGEAFASRRGAKGRSEQWELVPRSTSFLGPRLGSQIWSLQCLRQRARACFCDPYIGVSGLVIPRIFSYQRNGMVVVWVMGIRELPGSEEFQRMKVYPIECSTSTFWSSKEVGKQYFRVTDDF